MMDRQIEMPVSASRRDYPPLAGIEAPHRTPMDDEGIDRQLQDCRPMPLVAPGFALDVQNRCCMPMRNAI